MKKVLMLVAAVATLCSSSAFAQKVNLPTKGTFGTEVQFNPFDQNGHQFKLDALKLRYFLTDKDALRLSIGLDFGKTNEVTPLTEPDNDATQYDKDFYDYKKDNDENVKKTGHFSLDLGYERHFLKSGRIDLYAGAEIGIGLGWSKNNAVTGMGYQKPGFDEDKPSTYSFYTEETETNNGNTFDFNAAVFTGIDFYLYKGLYVGTELGLNLKNTSYGDAEATTTTNHPDVPSKEASTTTKYTNNNSGFDLGFYVEPTIRLGWSF